MVVTENKFKKLSELYQTLIKQFLILHNVKEAICTDTKEHFFDRIVVAENGSIKVFSHGFTTTTLDNLYFDFTCDYAVCLANMKNSISSSTKQYKQPINIH